MFPGSNIIPCPHGRVTLCARISSTCNRKWSLVKVKFLQALISRSNHLHPVNIMGFAMRTAVPFELMTDIVWESSSTEYSRFIHIIPKASYSIVYQAFIQGSPPSANFGVGEVRKLTATRPYKSFHKIIIPASAEVIILLTLLKYPILIVDLDSRIDHNYGLKAISR